MADPDLDLLRCFATVAEARNFTMAGERLGRSQSAVSVRIKKLEEQMGCQLLVRSNQDVQLTERGRALLPKARRILDDGERLLAEMHSPAVTGRLRIGVLEYIAPHRIPGLLGSLQRKLPDAELSFRVALSRHLLTALQMGEIDLALALHDPSSQNSTVMFKDPLVWVEAEDGDETAPDGEIALCLMQSPCIYRQAALEALSRMRTALREIVTANSVQSVRSAVASGLGCSVLGASCLGRGVRIARRLQDMDELPDAILSLHGEDHRKAEVVTVLRQVLDDQLRGGLSVGKDFTGHL